MLKRKRLTRVIDVLALIVHKVRVSLIRANSLILTPVVSIRARVHTCGVRQIRKLAVVSAGLIVLGGIGLNIASPATTFAANDSTINFQARLMNSAGSIVPDGTYNVEFKLYNVSSSSGSSQGSCTGDASCLWVETYTGGNAVNVVDGYLSVNLGSLSSFPGTINWNQPLYLGMRVGGTGTPSWDPEMSPRMQLTAVPYAFMANTLSTQTGTYQSTLTWATQHASNSLVLPDEAGTICVDGDVNGCSLGANYIQNGTALQSSANFNISGTGTSSTGFTAPQLQSASGALTVQGANGTVSLGTSTNLTASGALTIAAGGTNSNLALNNDGTGAINIGTNASGNNTIQIGDTTGTNTQYIDIGNNATSGSTTNLIVGSLKGGTLTLQTSGITQTFGGNNTITIANTSSSNTSTTAFQVQDGSSNTVLDVDTTDKFVGVGTSSPSAELTVSGTNLVPASVSSGNGTAASSAFVVTGAAGGATTAGSATGGTGAGVSLQGGTGGAANASGSTGGLGGNIAITAGSGGTGTSGTGGAGGQVVIKGGSAGSGATSGASGSVIVQSNGTNSTTAFEVQNASSQNVLTVDTSNGRTSVGIGSTPANGVLTIGTSSTSTSSGGLFFGADSSADLYRTGSAALKTDAGLTVAGSFTVGTGSVVMTFTPSVTAGSSSTMFELDGSSGTPADSDVFTANGELGIGTTAPSANLSFNQAGATINVNQSTGGTGGNLTIQGGTGKAGGNYNGGNLYLEAGAGTGIGTSGNVIVQSNGTNSTTAFEVQNAAGTSNLIIADTVNTKVGIAETPSSSGNTLQVAGGITATTGGILVSSGGETFTAASGNGITLNSNGISSTGAIAGATTYSGNSTLTLTGTNANELAVSGAPLASTTSSLVQVGNVLATGSTNGTYIGLNAPSGNTADFLNLEENGAVELKVTSAGALTTASTINGQTISSSASFTGTLSVGTFATGGTTVVCQNAGALATCAGGGSYIYNSSSSLQTSANIDIQSVGVSNATVQLQDISGQTADLIDFKDSGANIKSEITATGALQGANAVVSNTAGGALTINGGQGTGTGAGGNIVFQTAKAGTTGSSLNNLSTILTLSGANGSALFQNSANSTTAFTVEDTGNNSLINVDTSGDNVYLGSTGSATYSSNVHVGDSSSSLYVQNLYLGSNANSSDSLSLDAGSVAGSLQIGNSASAHSIKMGTNASYSQLITIGSSNSSSNLSLTGSGTAEVLSSTGDDVTIATGTNFIVQNPTTNLLQIAASTGAITTASTINGQTISSAANFTGTLTVGSLASGATTALCETGGELATCAGSGSYIYNQTALQTSANIDIQSTSTTAATVQLQDITGQTADLIDFKSSTPAIMSEITATGAFQGANGGTSNAAGGAVYVNGGQGTGTAVGGNIYFQTSPASGTSSSTLNNLSTILTLSGSNGSATFKNNVNSISAFVVQDSSSNQLLGVDTSGDNLYLGATGSLAVGSTVNIANSSSTSVIQHAYIGSNANASDSITLDGGTASNSIQIGNTSTAHGIQIGTSSSATQTIAIGSSASGSTINLTSGATTEDLSNTGDTLTIGTGDAFNVQNGTTSAFKVTPTTVTIGSGAAFQGTMFTDYLTNGSGTTTVTATDYGYDFSNNCTNNSGGTATFNITGLPNTQGTTAFITTTISKNGNFACGVAVQINGTTVGTVTPNGTGTLTEYYDYIAIYSDSMWRLVAQGPEGQNAVTAGNGVFTPGADYAEWIDYSGNNMPEPGDVLSLGSSPTTATDSSSPYDSTLLGVVSTNPYQVGGTDDGHSVVLALVGRVPVKVSLENGPILPGDPLTSSSTPGVAMKATGPGDIIGTALEGYDGTQSSNQIMIQLHVGYNNPGAQNGVLQGNQNVAGDLTVNGNTNLGGNASIAGDVTVNGGINVSGASSISSLLVGNTLTDNGNLEVEGTTITNRLQAQNGDISGSLSVSGNTSLASLLVGNDLSVNGNINVSGNATLTNLSVSGNTVTQNLTVSGTLTMAGDLQLLAKVNTRQATIKTFTASVPIKAGSVVILDTSQGNNGNVTTTTNIDDPRVIGVAVSTTTAANSPVEVAISGWVQVNVDTATINGNPSAAVQPGQLIVTSSTAGTVTASSSPAAGTILGKSTDSQDSNNQVWIFITLQ